MDSPENKPKIKRAKLTPQMEAVQWKPGQSGNPGGRPKKKPITELYEELLGDPDFIDALKSSLRGTVKKGNMAMVLQLREMTDRVEGKVTLPIEANVTMNLAEAMAAARKRAAE